MTKTIYIPTLMRYSKPDYYVIQYTGSKDIIKALHGFIEGLMENEYISVENYFDCYTEDDDMEEYYEKLNIQEDDDDETMLQKLCNFVKTKDDFNILIRMFGLEYEDSEMCSWFSIKIIELV